MIRHTCNPDQPGKPLPFGRRDPQGQCPRCAELDAGAEARGWKSDRIYTGEVRPGEIAAHDCATSGCGPVCTAHQW